MAYKLLVVDDEKDVLDIMRFRLAKEGYEVVTAGDGQEALEKVKTDNPDIVLMDLKMPKLNGYQVLEEIRTKHNDKWRPVIIISARDELESVERCYGMEADHYLTKPCDFEHISQGVRTMISLMSVRIK